MSALGEPISISAYRRIGVGEADIYIGVSAWGKPTSISAYRHGGLSGGFNGFSGRFSGQFMGFCGGFSGWFRGFGGGFARFVVGQVGPVMVSRGFSVGF